jgi:hypothetical protein
MVGLVGTVPLEMDYIDIGLLFKRLWHNRIDNSMIIHIECYLAIWWHNVFGHSYIYIYIYIYIYCCVNMLWHCGILTLDIYM